MKIKEIEDFVRELQLITEDHIRLMRYDKLEELISKAAHVIVTLKVELERHPIVNAADAMMVRNFHRYLVSDGYQRCICCGKELHR